MITINDSWLKCISLDCFYITVTCCTKFHLPKVSRFLCTLMSYKRKLIKIRKCYKLALIRLISNIGAQDFFWKRCFKYKFYKKTFCIDMGLLNWPHLIGEVYVHSTLPRIQLQNINDFVLHLKFKQIMNISQYLIINGASHNTWFPFCDSAKAITSPDWLLFA